MEIEEIKELVANKKFTTLKRKLEEMNSADISELLDELEDKESVIIVFRLLQKEKAVEMLDEMIKSGEEPIMIMIMLANQFRIIYQAKELYQQGYTEKSIASILNIHPFRIKKALEKGRMFTKDNLLTYLKQLAELDYQIKNSMINKRLGLELFFLGL